VGFLGASVNYSTFYIFYKAFSVYYVISSLLGYFIAAVAIFFLNRSWTFNIRSGHISKQFVMFILLISFSFVANGVSIYFFTDIVGFRAEVSQLITMGITTTINFLGSKFWVFRK
jgi:putative flippase GtrA